MRARSYGQVIVYDPRDCTCEKVETPGEHDCSKDVCVIDKQCNLYNYIYKFI